ncbi:E3 ubiquitin-protein ligase makorin-1 [Halotydeus destructor]|nr:E3 ubiquitin-protein ligase makorin-1 [Halotydeus destructor]
MAELGKRSLLCRFLMRGFCRNGAGCEFSHDEHESLVVPEDVCWYFLQGQCVYLTGCRFRHIQAEDIIAELQTSPSKSHRTVSEHSASTSQRRLSFNSSPTNSNDEVEDEDSSDEILPNSYEDKREGHYKALRGHRLVPFHKSNNNKTSGNSSGSSSISYAQACKDKDELRGRENERKKKQPLCPYGMVAFECPNSKSCNYLHGDRCDFCNRLCLHPFNEEQQKEHHDECVREHEKQMELSFAIQRSVDKACGICMDNVVEKEPQSERRFGILEKCAHIFCLTCIRKWRQTKQFDNKTIRACPECRISSDFVVPSRYWVDDKGDKDKLIESYKKALKQKPCKYFNQGRGECPFAGACFYLHAFPDGSMAELSPPRPRRRQANEAGELETLRDMLLWNYLEVREDRANQWMLTLDLEDIFDMNDFALFSETDDESDFEVSDSDNMVDFLN